MTERAFEVHGTPGRVPIVFTCEHASNRVPAGYRVDADTERLLHAHWGHDIGAAWVTRALAELSGGVAVLSCTTRLLLDANRAPDDPTLVLARTLDGPVSFNESVDAAELTYRLAAFHDPFHDAVAGVVQEAEPRLLVSIHSFTPVWAGVPRRVEAGVLFDDHDDLAHALVVALRQEGFVTEPNEPYSGKAGLIYSPARHGRAAELPYLELELRQDLIDTPGKAEAVALRVFRALLASDA